MSSRQLEMIFKTSKTGTGEKQAVDGLKDVKQGAAGALQELTGLSLGTMGVAGAMTLLAAGLGAAVRGAMEAETITADLNATIKSTKGVAGLTADEIQNMAQEFSDLTGIEDDSIVKSQALLLTFTSIGKDVFPDATEAVLNLSSKLGSLESATTMVGKALNVTKGDVSAASMAMSALKRVGVAFTTDQVEMGKELIKVGDVMGYQKLILGELNTEFGGLAEAMGNTTQGKINKAKNALGNLGETIGGFLLPALGAGAEALTNLIKGIDGVITRNDKLNQSALDVSETYDEYIAKLQEQIEAEGNLVDAHGKLSAGYDKNTTAAQKLVKEHGALTEVDWKLKNGMYDVTETGMIMAGMMANQAVSAADELTEALDTQEQKTSALKSVMSEYSTQLLFNQASQGLSAEASLVLADSMGLVYGKTQEAMGQLALARAEYQKTGDAYAYARAVQEIADQADRIQSKSVTIEVKTKYVTEGVNNNPWGKGQQDMGYANGADFIVPPGYPNDSFNMRVQSGEHVVVTPANQVTNNTGGSITFSGPVYMNSAQDIDILAGKLTSYWQRQGRN